MWSNTHAHTNAHMNSSEMARGAFAPAANIYRVGTQVHFNADVTHESMHALAKVMREVEADILKVKAQVEARLTLSADEQLVVEGQLAPKAIELHLTTYGGAVHAALAMVDTISMLRVPVHTVVSGFVASAGTLISLAGARRSITPHAMMLVHEVRGGVWGRASEVREQCENIDKLMAAIIRFYTERSKLTEEQLREVLRRDRDWSAQECLVHGLVDEILQPRNGARPRDSPPPLPAT